MNIRAALLADAPEIARIHIQAWQAAYKGMMSQEFLDSLSLEKKTATWQRILNKDDGGHYEVVLHDDSIAGFMVWGPARDEDLRQQNAIELVALNIGPEYWRKGCGAALVAKLIETAKQEKAACLVLWSASDNARAIAFYKTFGFEADGTERTDSTHGNDPLPEARYRLGL